MTAHAYRLAPISSARSLVKAYHFRGQSETVRPVVATGTSYEWRLRLAVKRMHAQVVSLVFGGAAGLVDWISGVGQTPKSGFLS